VENVITIGDWIKAQRQRQNLTPGHVALKMGIATVLIQSWENGISQPHFWQIGFLASVFGAIPIHQPTQIQ